jgi:hypothetical protein
MCEMLRSLMSNTIYDVYYIADESDTYYKDCNWTVKLLNLMYASKDIANNKVRSLMVITVKWK